MRDGEIINATCINKYKLEMAGRKWENRGQKPGS